MFALTFGGEMIFSPPCHLPRYYRPMVLEVLGLSNANFWEAVACCGIAAVIGYFPSGILVDHLWARRLIKDRATNRMAAQHVPSSDLDHALLVYREHAEGAERSTPTSLGSTQRSRPPCDTTSHPAGATEGTHRDPPS